MAKNNIQAYIPCGWEGKLHLQVMTNLTFVIIYYYIIYLL